METGLPQFNFRHVVSATTSVLATKATNKCPSRICKMMVWTNRLSRKLLHYNSFPETLVVSSQHVPWSVLVAVNCKSSFSCKERMAEASKLQHNLYRCQTDSVLEHLCFHYSEKRKSLPIVAGKRQVSFRIKNRIVETCKLSWNYCNQQSGKDTFKFPLISQLKLFHSLVLVAVIHQHFCSSQKGTKQTIRPSTKSLSPIICQTALNSPLQHSLRNLFLRTSLKNDTYATLPAKKS